jgi:hypothetical protein
MGCSVIACSVIGCSVIGCSVITVVISLRWPTLDP